MGRTAEQSGEREFLTKFQRLFADVVETLRKENPEQALTFDDFASHFDEKDRFTRRLLEFMIKETLHSRPRDEAPPAEEAPSSRGLTTLYLLLNSSSGGTSTFTVIPPSIASALFPSAR